MEENIRFNIEKLRKENDLSTTDIASIIKCSERAYRNKEKGLQPFKLSEILILLERFGLKFEQLL